MFRRMSLAAGVTVALAACSDGPGSPRPPHSPPRPVTDAGQITPANLVLPALPVLPGPGMM